MPGEAPVNLRHLDYSGRAKSHAYTAKGGGGGRFKLVPRQRAAHAAQLRGELQTVQQQIERVRLSQELSAYEEDAGISLEIRGVPGYPMKLEPLDVPSRGIVLENSRVETVALPDGGTAPVVVATVFVKHGKLIQLSCPRVVAPLRFRERCWNTPTENRTERRR